MTDAEILQSLTPIFREIFENDAVVAVAGMIADDVPEWDSVSHMGLILAVEKEFGIRFNVGQVGRANTVDGLIAIIRENIGK